MKFGRRGRVMTRGTAWILAVVLVLCTSGTHGAAWTITAQAAEKDEGEEDCILSLFDDNSAAIKEDGSLWLWGMGVNNVRRFPVKTMEGAKAVSVGTYHIAVLKEDDSLWLWGDDQVGQLGNGDSDFTYDVPIKLMDGVKDFSMGYKHSAAVTKDGSLWTWGYNMHGQLGNGKRDGIIVSIPGAILPPDNGMGSDVPIKIMDNVRSVSLGDSHSAAIKNDGSLWLWGYNQYGQVGTGKSGSAATNYLDPVKIMSGVKSVSLGRYHSAAIKEDDSLWLWGSNSSGQLGVDLVSLYEEGEAPSKTLSSKPIKVMEDVKAVSLGAAHSAAIKNDGSLWIWGNNSYGQVGSDSWSNEKKYEPIKVMDHVKSVSLGSAHSAAIKEDGSLWVWGSNDRGQVGNDSWDDMFDSPVQIMLKTMLPAETESSSQPKIRIIDPDGRPIDGAEVTYRENTYTTSYSGIVELADYESGFPLTISKEGYETKDVSSYTEGGTGCDTYMLFPIQGDEPDSAVTGVFLTVNGKETDVLVKEATLNRFFKDTECSIRCEGGGGISSYVLYSGDKLISLSNNGTFSNLRYDTFTAGEPVILETWTQATDEYQKIRLGIQVIDQEFTMPGLTIVEPFKIDIPNNIPLVGGKTLKMDLKDPKIIWDIDTNGEIRVGINVAELNKKGGWFGAVKSINVGNAGIYLDGIMKRMKGGDDIYPEINVIGYLEGNILTNDRLKGKLFAELLIEGASEYQKMISFVPVVIEVSISGKVNSDGSITYAVEEGYSGSLSIGGEAGAGLYGGVGMADAVSLGLYGEAALGLRYDIFPESVKGLNQAYIKGEAGAKLKFFGEDLGRFMIIDGTYHLISTDAGIQSVYPIGVFAIDNDRVYSALDRSYLSANGGTDMQWSSGGQKNADGNVQEAELQASAYLDIIPQVVRAGETVMLFYTTDAGAERSAADRSMLVYSVYNNADGSWSSPTAVLDDGTADFSPDIYADGSKVYAVWQNADKSLTEGLTLNEIADRLTLHAAVYDAKQNTFTDLGEIRSENDLFQQRPQIVADGDRVSVYWHENAQDNVLGLSGMNRIYQAVLEGEQGAGQNPDGSEENPDEKDKENTGGSEDNTDGPEENPDEENKDNTDGSEENPDEEDKDNTDGSEENPDEGNKENPDGSEENPDEGDKGDPDYSEGDEPNEGEDDVTHLSDEDEPEASNGPEQKTDSSFRKYVAVAVNGEDTLHIESEEMDQTGAGSLAGDEDGERTGGGADTEGRERDEEGSTGTANDADEEGGTGAENGSGDESGTGTENDTDKEDGTGTETGSGEEGGTDIENDREEESGSDSGTGEGSGGDTENGQDSESGGESEEGGETAEEPEEEKEEGTEKESIKSVRKAVMATGQAAESADNAWKITFIREEAQCIVSADAGRTGQKSAYAYVAGTLNDQYEITQGSVVLIPDGENGETLENGVPAHAEFVRMYGEDTLTWYQDGDIHYTGGGSITSLFGERKLSNAVYTLISDGSSVEVIFPVNAGGRSNLYRLAAGAEGFGNALPVTDQEDYIQYADGFIDGGRTVLVYNRMEIDENLEEVNNSLCTGVLEHNFHDIVLYSAGSTIIRDEMTGVDVLEITARIGNNGTDPAQGLSLSLSQTDGTVLETKPVESTLQSGEAAYGTAVFSLDNITEAGEYTVTVLGGEESNTADNSVVITLGGAALEVEADVVAAAGTRIVQAGIRNTGITPCGGTVVIRDPQTGEEYCRRSFGPISRGTKVRVELPVTGEFFAELNEDVLSLEVAVTPEDGTADLYDYVTVYAPMHQVKFVTDTGKESIYVTYGHTAAFPENPSREGELFRGWYTAKDPAEGTLYTEDTPITENVTLYACFMEKNESIPLENCSVSAIPAQLYTGGQIKPAVTVKWGSTVLQPKKDYTLAYSNNKEQGRAEVVITGKGRCSGSISRSFMILYPFNKVSVKAIPAVDYTGEAHTPPLTVTYRNQTLKQGKDYNITYANNRNAGTAGVILTGTGMYSGTKKATFTIRGISITGMVIDKPDSVIYSGGKQTPVITVKTGEGKQLRAGADYKTVYENAVDKGTATVTVIGNGNYTGAKKLTYKILAKPLAEEMAAAISPESYTGTALKPEVTMTDSGKELEPNKDYTVAYSGNRAVGTGTVKITGKGNYSGTLQIPFTITAKSLEDEDISVHINDMAYTGRALKPKVEIRQGTRKIPASAYTVSYANNTDKGTAQVMITGRGNYTGEVSAGFRIVDKAKLVASLNVDKIPDVVYTGSAVEPELTIRDGSYVLKRDIDYTATYEDQYNAGKAKVTIRGIGTYAGSRQLTYKIGKRAMADRNVLETDFTIEPVKEQKYTGGAIKPDVVLKDGDKVLELNKDYRLSWQKNTSPGTARITVTGTGNYTGSVNTVSFKIVTWDYDSMEIEIPEQVYTGKAIKPKMIFRVDGEEIDLKTGSVMKIVYADNRNAGTATVSITGKGALKDMKPVSKTFEIRQASLEDAVVGRIKNQTLKGAAATPVPKVKVGKNTLKLNRDFTVRYLKNGVKGEAEIIITGKGNYTDSCRQKFIIQ